MKFLDGMISKPDAAVMRTITESEIKQREFRNEASLHNNLVNRAILEAYDSIDTKATAILRPVPIMIAATGILYSSTHGVFKIRFGFETLFYVLVTMFCLRLFMTRHHATPCSDTENVVMRKAILDLVSKLTFLISVILVGTLVAELVTQ